MGRVCTSHFQKDDLPTVNANKTWYRPDSNAVKKESGIDLAINRVMISSEGELLELY